MQRNEQQAPYIHISAPQFVKNIGDDLCELVQAVYLGVSVVYIIAECFAAHMVQPSGSIQYPSCLQVRQIQSKCQQPEQQEDAPVLLRASFGK